MQQLLITQEVEMKFKDFWIDLSSGFGDFCSNLCYTKCYQSLDDNRTPFLPSQQMTLEFNCNFTL